MVPTVDDPLPPLLTRLPGLLCTVKMLCVVATETEARRQPITTSHSRAIRSAVSGSRTGIVSALHEVPTSCNPCMSSSPHILSVSMFETMHEK